MCRRTFLEEIGRLAPARDYRRIVFIDTYHEFPWDMARALEFALFRSFAVPRISALLDQTGEFVQRTERRYDDTDLILNEILEHGWDSDRDRTALRRMNLLHHRFPIDNDNFLYVMSTLIFESIRWNERFGWRAITAAEKLADYTYWRNLGSCMNVASTPESYDDFERFNREYERIHVRFAASNRRVADANLDLVMAGPFRFTRHSGNLAPIGVLALFPRMTVNLATLTIMTVVYGVVGALHEE